MSITITAERRMVLWADVVADLATIDSIHRAIEDGEWEKARALRCRYEQDMRLLDDIGWAQHQPDERFDLTIAPDQLRTTLQRLHEYANRHAHRLLGDTQAALACIDVYAALLGQVRDQDDG
jgi:non-ribosomal peptide synthetase component F